MIMNMIKRISDIVKEMVAGIIAVGLVVLLLGVIFVPDKLWFALGVLLGMAVAIVMVFIMHHSISKALDFADSRAATITNIKGYAFRTVILIGGFIASYFMGIWSIAGYFLGVMSMKGAAYLQPCTKKILHH